jgi:hypothetical protein
MGGRGSGGMNRVSVQEHRARGTFKAHRHGHLTVASPAPDVPPVQASPGTPDDTHEGKVPPMPGGLSPASQALWRRFHTEYTLTSVPAQELLESALRSRDLAERARAVLEADGLTFTDSGGKPKPHPAAAIHRDARSQFVGTLKTLGFPDFPDTGA